MTPTCGWCDQAARYKVTGTDVHHTCDQHYQHAARAAGVPPHHHRRRAGRHAAPRARRVVRGHRVKTETAKDRRSRGTAVSACDGSGVGVTLEAFALLVDDSANRLPRHVGRSGDVLLGNALGGGLHDHSHPVPPALLEGRLGAFVRTCGHLQARSNGGHARQYAASPSGLPSVPTYVARHPLAWRPQGVAYSGGPGSKAKGRAA